MMWLTVWWEEHFCPRAELPALVVPEPDVATQPSPRGAPELRCVVNAKYTPDILDFVGGGEKNGM